MENPATWNDIQRTIDSALDLELSSDVQASKVYSALLQAGMLAPSVERSSDCLLMIVKTIEDDLKMFLEGYCGLSLTSQIYQKLLEGKMLKE